MPHTALCLPCRHSPLFPWWTCPTPRLLLVLFLRINEILVLLVKNAPSPRCREQEEQEEQEARAHMRRRMDAVLALKNSVTANRVGARLTAVHPQKDSPRASQHPQSPAQPSRSLSRQACVLPGRAPHLHTAWPGLPRLPESPLLQTGVPCPHTPHSVAPPRICCPPVCAGPSQVLAGQEESPQTCPQGTWSVERVMTSRQGSRRTRAS